MRRPRFTAHRNRTNPINSKFSDKERLLLERVAIKHNKTLTDTLVEALKVYEKTPAT